jgi:pyruvate kinase
MLSGETAAGAHPVEAVEMMDRIIRSAEAEAPDESDASIHPQVDDHSYVIALAARQIVQSDANMKGIACFTRSGYSARLLSKVHPRVPIYGLTPTDGVCRQLALARGVVPVLTPFVETSEAMLHWTDTALVEDEHLSPGDEVCVVASLPVRAVGRTNFLKLHRLGETP